MKPLFAIFMLFILICTFTIGKERVNCDEYGKNPTCPNCGSYWTRYIRLPEGEGGGIVAYYCDACEKNFFTSVRCEPKVPKKLSDIKLINEGFFSNTLKSMEEFRIKYILMRDKVNEIIEYLEEQK